MQKSNSLSELVKLVALTKRYDSHAMQVANGGTRTTPSSRKVGDMLGTVLALAARTRRLVLPPVSVELDVFRPDGSRAVRIVCDETGSSSQANR